MSDELSSVSALAEFFDPSEENFIKAVLVACAKHKCLFYVERGSEGRTLLLPEVRFERGVKCRFSILLPDTRVVSSVRWDPPMVALSRICRAVHPYLVKFEQDEFDRLEAEKRFAKPLPEKAP